MSRLCTSEIGAPGIVIDNLKIIHLSSYKFYVGSHKVGFGIVNYNPRRTHVLLCQNSTLLALLKVHLSFRVRLNILVQFSVWHNGTYIMVGTFLKKLLGK